MPKFDVFTTPETSGQNIVYLDILRPGNSDTTIMTVHEALDLWAKLDAVLHPRHIADYAQAMSAELFSATAEYARSCMVQDLRRPDSEATELDEGELLAAFDAFVSLAARTRLHILHGLISPQPPAQPKVDAPSPLDTPGSPEQSTMVAALISFRDEIVTNKQYDPWLLVDYLTRLIGDDYELPKQSQTVEAADDYDPGLL